MKQLAAHFKDNGYNSELIITMLYKVLGKNPSIAVKYGSENCNIVTTILASIR